MLKNITPRLYQQTILSTCVLKNCLVVLPTGMGKTLVALLLAVHRLKQYPNSKIVFLSPTRPLVEQHLQTFKQYMDLPEESFVMFTGHVPPEKRAKQWETAKIIFTTPQGLENDVMSKKISFKDVSLCVFDEAHRAVGDYSYVFLGAQYYKKADYPRLLALTASPGSDLEKIHEVCNNLHIEEVELRTPEDPDVAPYIQDIDITYVKVKLPEELLAVKKFLDQCVKEKLTKVKELGYLNSIQVNKTDILKLQGQLHAKLARGEKDFEMLRSISLLAEAMKVQHALELLETQGIVQLQQYIAKLEKEAQKGSSKAVKNLVKDLNFRSAKIKLESVIEKKIDHPKLDKIKELLKQEVKNTDSKVIVFTQYRDSAARIKEVLDEEPFSSNVFLGQTKKGETGMTQKQQVAMLNEFRLGLFNVLICTSVGEEGLDIPSVDSVVFYEPVPSAIRAIQRRGRTGRQEKGKMYMLIAEGTRDEGYRWSAHHKEKRMHRLLKDLKDKISLAVDKKQKHLDDFGKQDNSKLKIAADFREKGSPVLKELIADNVDLQLEQLKSADFILSERVGVEYKTVPDFVNSIIDNRLLPQLKELKRNFQKPLLILEGEEDIYSIRNVHANAIRGMLAAITVSFSIPILPTRNPKETASVLQIIAKREQEEAKQEFSLHTHKKAITLSEQQEFIVSAFPGIGPVLAKPLLKEFKTIKDIVIASEEDLKNVSLIGKLKAKSLKEVFEKEYTDDTKGL